MAIINPTGPLSSPNGFLVPVPASEPQKYGLVDALKFIDINDAHWQTGVTWENKLCVNADTTLPDCPVGTQPAKHHDRGLTFGFSDPFTVYGHYTCSTVGRPAQEAFDIATARLISNEHKSVESTFWTGTTDVGTVRPSLAIGDPFAGITPVDLTPGGGAVDAVSALFLLERALSQCAPGLGLIHINYGLMNYFAYHHLVHLETEPDGTQCYYTKMGQKVVAGAGYPGSGPSNVAALTGENWIFASSQVHALKSEIFLTPDIPKEAINRNLNDITVFAERTWSLGFSCCLFAVRMQLVCCGS